MKKYTNTYQPENDAQLDALLNNRVGGDFD